MNKDELFHDFNLICEMNVPPEIKEGMLTQLFRADTNRWRVVGITKDALLRFKENNFKRVTGIKIHRAHKNDRSTIYKEMLSRSFANSNEWWDFYSKNDETVLATSSQNRTKQALEIIEIDQALGLFRSRGYSWIHNKSEINHLEEQYRKHFSSV